MSAGSYDGRHRGAQHSTPKQRRFLTGLALPTAAAAALTFCATGAAVVTSANTAPSAFSQNTTPPRPSREATAAVQIRDPRIQAIEDNAQDLARENAGARVARDAERKRLAARELAAEQLEEAHSWQLPITNYVRTSGFGWRWGRLHEGEDFAAPTGTDLVSMSSGTVTFAGRESGYGTLVKIRYWDGTTSYFAHMSSTSVEDGEVVEPGEVVGQSGNSGHSTGPHLHLEIHPDGEDAVDPLPWLTGHKVAT